MATPANTTQLGTLVDEHPKGGFPAFQTETFAGQLIWLALTFGLLYYLMSKVALPKVGAVLQDRSERIARDLDEAQAMRTKAEEASAAYETSLAQARDKAKGIAGETRDRLAAEGEARRKELEGELASRLDAAEELIAGQTRAAMGNVRAIAEDAAAAIVERLTGRAPDPAQIQAGLDRAAPRS